MERVDQQWCWKGEILGELSPHPRKGVMIKMKQFLLLSLILLFSFATSTQAEETAPIKIGAILHLSGDLAMQGVAFREGIELAVDRVNKNGGIRGRKISVVYEDTNFNSSNVHRAAKKLIEQDHVRAAIISTFHEAKTAGPLFERAKIPLLCLWDSTPELDSMGQYLFSIGTWLPSTGATTAHYARDSLHAASAAVISTNREWSLRVGNDFAKVFQEAGGEVVYHEAYNPGESDFRSIFLKMKSEKPDVLYAPVDDNIGTFFKQLKESGLGVPVIQSDNLNHEWVGILGEALEGVYQSQSMEPSNDQATEMAKLYKAKFGKEPSQVLFHAWGFDGLGIIAQAIKENGSEPNEIRIGIAHVKNYPGAIGPITISPEGSHRVGVSVFQIRNGEFTIVNG